MTEQRKSAVIAKESTFASGTKSGGYCRLPTGYHITHSISTPGSSVYETGNKIRVGATYGPIDGQWQISYNTDYDNIEPMTMVFDEVITFLSPNGVTTAVTTYYDRDGTAHSFGSTRSSTIEFSYTAPTAASNSNTAVITDLVSGRSYSVDLPDSQGIYMHLFIKRNNTRPGNYIIREKTLHRIVNERSGAGDEVTELWGAVPSAFQISKTSTSSEMQAAIQGVFADQQTREVGLDATDYTALDGDSMTQQACMWIGSTNDSGNFVEDMDSFNITMSNNVQLVKNMCSRVAGTYMEGQNSFRWDATTYHNDVTMKFLRRVFTGGVAGDEEKPRNKNMMPLPVAKFMTFNGEVNTTNTTRAAAYNASTEAMTFYALNSTLRDMTWQTGNGDLMKQNMSSVECDEIYAVVRNDDLDVWADTLTSVDPSNTIKTFKTSVYRHVLTKSTIDDTEYQNVDEWATDKYLTVNVGTNTTGVPNYASYRFPYSASTAITPITIDNAVIVPYNTTSDDSTAISLKNQIGGKLSPIALSAYTVRGEYNNSRVLFRSPNTNMLCYVQTAGFDTSAIPSDTNPSDKTCHVVIDGTPSLKGVDYYLLARPATSTRFEGTTLSNDSEEMELLGILRIEVY